LKASDVASRREAPGTVEASLPMSSTTTVKAAQVPQATSSVTVTHSPIVGSRLGSGLRSSSGLVTLRAILRNALREEKKTKATNRKSDEPGAKECAAVVAALVVYSGVAWL
jgi:hypothetical protein